MARRSTGKAVKAGWRGIETRMENMIEPVKRRPGRPRIHPPRTPIKFTRVFSVAESPDNCVRFEIILHRDQFDKLGRLAADAKVSKSEIARQAIVGLPG